MSESGEHQWHYLAAGQQVGPVGQAEILVLIGGGRITSATMVWRAGLATWEPAGKTELGPHCAAGAVSASVPLSPPPAIPQARDKPGRIPIWRCIKESFGLMFRNPAPFILGNLFFLMMNALAFGLLGGAWQAGMMLVTRKARAGQPVVFTDIFQGFDRFGLVLGAGMVFQVAFVLGLMFCVVPGYIVAAQLLYLLPLVAIKGCSIAEAITISRQMARTRLWNHFLFCVTVGLVGLSGMILCYVGLVLTLPIIPMALAIAYEKNFEKEAGA